LHKKDGKKEIIDTQRAGQYKKLLVAAYTVEACWQPKRPGLELSLIILAMDVCLMFKVRQNNGRMNGFESVLLGLM
jgi:hypothetical protein